MKVFIESPGTGSRLMLRIYQCAFVAVSIAVMFFASDFSSYTTFCNSDEVTNGNGGYRQSRDSSHYGGLL
ncbi:hypothetical protein V6Z11_A12G174800 [Gossypium hirsutum]|nr:hypothetical protein ES288_A12G171600v1 [Gossypium darwinii]